MVFIFLFILFAVATAREAIPMSYGALTGAGLSLAAYLANRFGRGGFAKFLFFLAFIAGFGVTYRGLKTLRTQRANTEMKALSQTPTGNGLQNAR